MRESRLFQAQRLGFYFAVNELAWSDDESAAREAAQEAAYAIHAEAYRLLEAQLPQEPLWMKQDEHDPAITYSPYEVCEIEALTEDVGGLEAHSFWLYSFHTIEADTAWAFQPVVAAAYAQAAEKLGGRCRFLKLESSVTEEVTTTIELVRPPQQSVAGEGLTATQQAYLEQVAAEGLLSEADRERMAGFLRTGASVIVLHQRELWDAPPFAVAPVDAQDFWLGTWHTAEEAAAMAAALGLQVQAIEGSAAPRTWPPFNPACIPLQSNCRWFVRRADTGLADTARGFRSKDAASAWIDSFGQRLDWRAGFTFRLKGDTTHMEIVSRNGEPAKA